MGEPCRLWHVTVTVAGERVEPLIVKAALRRLAQQRPFLHSMKYAPDRAEIQFWEEADTLLDASSLSLRVWNEHRDSAGLPVWEVVGLEVLERDVHADRHLEYPGVVDMGDISPLPF